MAGERQRLMRRERCWVAVVLLAACACARGSGLELRLERELSPVTPGPADQRTQMLLHFGMGGLRHRIALLRDRADAVREEHRLLSRSVDEHAQLVARLRNLSQSQDQAMDGLRAALSAPAVAPAPAPVTGPLTSAPPVEVAAERPEAAPVAPTGVFAGIVSLDWMTATALGAVVLAVIALLAFVLRGGRSRAAAGQRGAQVRAEATAGAELPGAASTTAVAAHGTKTPDPEASGRSGAPGSEAVVLDFFHERQNKRTSQAAAAGAGSASTPGPALDEQWSRPAAGPKVVGAGRHGLKEVDTLIAFEQYDQAKEILEAMLAEDAENPELLLRHYHVRTQGGTETATDDAELLRAMMEGPLSDTMTRMREIGRGLTPGDPLIQDEGQRDEALKVLGNAKGRSAKIPAPAENAARLEDDDEFFMTAVKLGVSPGRASAEDAPKT
jgi:hypothetical protein